MVHLPSESDTGPKKLKGSKKHLLFKFHAHAGSNST